MDSSRDWLHLCLRRGAIALATFAAICFPRVALPAETVSAAFAKARHTFRLIQTVEFVQSFTTADGRRPRKKFTAKQVKFLTELNIDANKNPGTPEIVTAFDGKRHQKFSNNGKSLLLSNGPQDGMPQGDTNALTIPLAWLMSPEGQFMLSDIREAAAWERVERDATLAGAKSFGGVSCVHIVLKYPQGTVNVYLSPSHGYLPLKHDTFSPDGTFSNGVEVTKWASFPVDGETAYVPTIVVYDQAPLGAGLPAKHEIIEVDTTTLKVNHPLDDDIFTISPSRAEIIKDRDMELKENTSVPVHRKEEAGSPLVLYASLGLVALALGAAGLAWYVRRS